MDIYLNAEKSPAVWQARADGGVLSSLRLKRGAVVPMSVVILGSTSASQLKLGIKIKNDYEGVLMALSTADSGTMTEEGMRFVFDLAVSSLALDEALDVGGGKSSVPATLAAMAEIAWWEEGRQRLSDTLPTTLCNDIVRLASEAPEAAAEAYPAADMVATKSWVQRLEAGAASAGLARLESDGTVGNGYTAVAKTPGGALAVPGATAQSSGTVQLGTADILTGKTLLPVGVSSAGGLAVNAAGLNAYSVALKDGFVGTEQEWLASLKGERGDKGEQGEPGKDADMEQLVATAVERIMTPTFDTLTHATVSGNGEGNLYWTWFELAAVHAVEGRLVSISIPCRTSGNESVGAEALYLSVWQQDVFGSWRRLGCSTHAVTQHVGQTDTWEFDSIPIEARALRFCAQSTPEEGWSSTHVLGGRSQPSSDGSTITYVNSLNHVLLATLVFFVPQSRFVKSSDFDALSARVAALEGRASS